MTSSAVLELRGISTMFGGYKALDRVDFTVDRGEVRGLIGSNGAGKSTLLNVGVGGPGGTRCRFGDVPRNRYTDRAGLAARPARDRAQIPGQRGVRAARRRGEHAARGPAEGAGGGDSNLDLVDDVLDLVGLGPKRKRQTPARTRRAAVAGDRDGAAHRSELLLDEPTSGMTLGESHHTAELIDRLRRSDRVEAMVVVEHDIDFIRLVSDRVTVLHHGRVLASGEVDEVQADPAVHDAYLGRLQ